MKELREYFSKIGKSLTGVYDQLKTILAAMREIQEKQEKQDIALEQQGQILRSVKRDVARLAAEWSGEPINEEEVAQFTAALPAPGGDEPEGDAPAQQPAPPVDPNTSQGKSPIRWGTLLQRVYLYIKEHQGKEGITARAVQGGLQHQPGSSIHALKKRGYIRVVNGGNGKYSDWQYVVTDKEPIWKFKRGEKRLAERTLASLVVSHPDSRKKGPTIGELR